MNKNYDYKRLTPFKWFVLQNFPFIDEDFDAITNYQLFCKLGEEINKLIKSMNLAGEQVEELTNYVNNFFDNLDVQDEINNKLDDMAESGQLTDIIAQYLQLAGLLCFNTKSDMKNAQNLSNGSFVKTLGTNTYNDGNGNFYKIRQLLNTDVIDDNNIIALNNYPTLIAELIPDNYKIKVDELDERVENLEENLEENYCIIMGDSYGASNNSWIDRLITKIDNQATCYKVALGGLGFSHQSSIGNYTFLTYLQSQYNNIPNPQKIKQIIVCGGYNDYNETYDNIVSAIRDFCIYCGTNFPNARVYIGMIGFNKQKTLESAHIRKKLQEIVLPAYSHIQDLKYNPIFIENSDLIMHNEDLIDTDNVHPTNTGMTKIAEKIYEWFIKGNINVNTINETVTTTHGGNINLIKTNNEITLWTQDEITFNLSGNPVNINSGYRPDSRTVIDEFNSKLLFPSVNGYCLIPTKATIVSNSISYRDVDILFGFSYDGKVILHTHTIENDQWVNYPNTTLIRIMYPLNMKVSSRFN